MSVTITFACRHTQPWVDGQDTPVCSQCGERRVARAKAPMPTFRGACRGPLAREEALGAMAVGLAPSGPLQLKES
jgi:hypothetical protein